MEKIKTPENNPEKQKEKVYLYHMVPEDMRGSDLHPLNILKEVHPDLFTSETAKYEGRKEVMGHFIHSLECGWNDVLHLSPIKPEDLKRALTEAGFEPKETKFYQIDPDLLDPSKTTIYLYQDITPSTETKSEDFADFDLNILDIHSIIPERTLAYYKESKVSGHTFPLLFVGVPHILHKGSIDISDISKVTVITV